MSDEKSKKFSIDAEQTGIHEMPSVTKLLNRKTLGLPPAASSVSSVAPPPRSVPPPSPAISAPHEDVEISLSSDMTFELESSGPSQSALEAADSSVGSRSFPEVRKTSKISVEGKLIPWEKLQLKQSSDPMAKSLWILIDQSTSQAALKSALFLSAQSSGAKTFSATAAFEEKSRSVLWAGMVWDPLVVPEVWNSLLKGGSIELSPASQVTDTMSDRNVVRGAFGIAANEWLTLIRVGTADSCRGVLALTSDSSLRSLLRAAMPGFGTVNSALTARPVKKTA